MNDFDDAISPAILTFIEHGLDELLVRRIWDAVRIAMLAASKGRTESTAASQQEGA